MPAHRVTSKLHGPVNRIQPACTIAQSSCDCMLQQHYKQLLAGAGGKVLGDVRVGGYPKEQASFARVSGYVEQFDIHNPLVRICPRILSPYLHSPASA